MTKPHAIVFSGFGLNCEEETKFAFEQAGGTAEIVHLNDLIANPKLLDRAQVVALPGGFSFGDDTGSGKAYGNRLRGHLRSALERFLSRDTLAIGICNGFQILSAAELVPGALFANDGGKYLCRWVDLEVTGESPWLAGIEGLSLPIAHGEGKFYAPDKMLRELKRNGQIALRYTKGDISQHFDLPSNPNGSLEDIAGVTARNGRVLGLMPHPERAISFFHQPHWTSVREQYLREGKPLPTEGPGLQLFKNAVRYFA